MNILCIETSTNCCSAAICMDGVAVASRENLVGANHASELPVFIDQLLAEAEEKSWKIDAIALSEGPGSYTGLRIGASLAKGLCYGLNVPLIPIDTLQILCASMRAQKAIPENSWLCPMLDARRMEVYTSFYLPTCLTRQTAVQAMIINENAFSEVLMENKLIFFGNGAEKCKDVILHSNATFVLDIFPQAKYMGELAETAQQLDIKQMAYYEPFYLKEFVPAASHVKGLN
jgi:tRNA threonylcarbamoyladenosine biosynthesis protein TsaB